MFTLRSSFPSDISHQDQDISGKGKLFNYFVFYELRVDD